MCRLCESEGRGGQKVGGGTGDVVQNQGKQC